MGGSSNYHSRSYSLPTRPHPLVSECDEHISKLKSLDLASWSPNSMTQKLTHLQDLHECVNKLLLLRRTREAFAAHRREKWVDELFDGSLRLLDMCSSAKDGVIHTKECVRELQSMVRRRHCWGSCSSTIGVANNEIEKYLASRKVVKRAIQKALASVKVIKQPPNSSLSSISSKDPETVSLISLLFEIEATSQNVFESILSYVSGKKGPKNNKSSKINGWALVSKLIMRSNNKSSSSKSLVEQTESAEESSNEFAIVDAALLDSVAGRKSDFSSMGLESSINNGDVVTDQLGKLDSCVQDFERGLDGLFRRLIRNRVSLLNILNH